MPGEVQASHGVIMDVADSSGSSVAPYSISAPRARGDATRQRRANAREPHASRPPATSGANSGTPRRCPPFAQLPVQPGRRKLIPLRRLAVALRPSRPRLHQEPIPRRAAAGTTRVDLHADTTRIVGGLLVAWSQGASDKGRNFVFENGGFPRSLIFGCVLCHWFR